MTDYPNVPNVPGVPAVPRDPLAAAVAVIELLTQDTLLYGYKPEPEWGIYQNGRPIITADTVLAFNFKREWAIADYQVERGGFESYDKVDLPYDARVRFASGGSEANRQELLDSIKAIAGNLVLYDVVTPEEVYTSVNVAHYDFQRQSTSGLGLIQVDVWLLEIRVAGNSGQNVKSPSSASVQHGSQVQPTEPTAAEINALTPTNL